MMGYHGIIGVLFLVGLVVEAITGALAAGRYRLDLMGVIFIALVTALGGGAIRDICFDHHPMTWIKNPELILLIIISALATTKIAKMITKIKKTFLILDAVGLVVFSIVGTEIVMQLHQSIILAVCGGVITGVFGGILRDILCNQIPLIFQKEIYASVSILSSLLFYILINHTDLGSEIASLITLVCGTCLRLLSLAYGFGLPVFHFDEEKE